MLVERVFRWELCDEDDDDVKLQTTEINVNFLAIIKDEEDKKPTKDVKFWKI
jgi:hypothetical protein